MIKISRLFGGNFSFSKNDIDQFINVKFSYRCAKCKTILSEYYSHILRSLWKAGLLSGKYKPMCCAHYNAEHN